MNTNPKVDSFFKRTKQWHNEMARLREVVLGCGLTEELKWGQPCYTIADNRNILVIHGFKEYCALLFFKGALMKDPEKILIQQTENVQSGRQIRFIDVREIEELEPILKEYIFEAIEVEKAGLKVDTTKKKYTIPIELQTRLDEDSAFRTAFQALTPGRQRGYLLYFAQAKQSKTRISRIERSIPNIMAGKGYNEE